MGTPYSSGILKPVENSTLALAGADVLSRTNFLTGEGRANAALFDSGTHGGDLARLRGFARENADFEIFYRLSD
jgi:hypothetical protein